MNPQYPQNPYEPQQQPQPQPQPYPTQQFPVPGTVPAAPYAPNQPAFHVPASSGRPSKNWLVIAIVAITTTLVFAGLAIWAFMNYIDQKNNVDSKVSTAVASSVKDAEDKAAAHLLEVENEPNRKFVGPDDYGRLSFMYSKLWSVYIAKDAAAGGNFEAYFNPATVPPVSDKQQYALRVLIEDKDYDKVVASYKSAVDKGDLKYSTIKLDDISGARLDGAFSKDIKGAAVIFKIRDKTVTIRTDAETFLPYFEALVKTITFNK